MRMHADIQAPLKYTHIYTKSTHYPLADLGIHCNKCTPGVKQENVQAQGASCWDATMEGFTSHISLSYCLWRTENEPKQSLVQLECDKATLYVIHS